MSKLTINTAKLTYVVKVIDDKQYLVLSYSREVIARLEVKNKVGAMKAVAKNHSWFERAVDRYMILGYDIPNPFMVD